MKITNFNEKEMPIQQIQLQRKVIAFKCIVIYFIDQNVIAFLRHFHQLFAACQIDLRIETTSDRISEFILCNIWPMLGKNIHGIELPVGIFHRLRQFTPSLLNECPSLRIFNAYYFCFFPEFPCNDNAAASDGQAVAKWLFTPLQDNVPKVFNCWLQNDEANLTSKVEAFASASSPSNFIISISFPLPFASSVVPFALTNELTREQLVLKRTDNNRRFLLIRCPIARDESKWTKWEKEAID